MVRCQAHNLKTENACAGSIPAPATLNIYQVGVYDVPVSSRVTSTSYGESRRSQCVGWYSGYIVANIVMQPRLCGYV